MKYHISTQRIIPQNVGGLLQDDKKRGKLFKIQTIQDMGRNECDEASVSCSNFFTIIWVKQGHGSYIADKDKVEIYHNTIYCVKPGQLYSFNPCENTEGYVISFLQNFLCSLYNHPNSLPKCRLFNSILLGVIIPVDAKTRIEMNILVESMIREFSNSDFVSNEILSGLLKIFLLYLNRQFEQEHRQLNKHGNLNIVNKFFHLLEKNYITWKMVSEYAKELYITPNYLNEIIKNVTGFSASHHIQQRVILEAKRKAAFPEATMKEVAYDLGFNDIYHFSKYFKNVCGINFSEFKKENTKQFLYA